ncbi:Hemolysin activator protein, partial [Pseudomonas cichorii]
MMSVYNRAEFDITMILQGRTVYSYASRTALFLLLAVTPLASLAAPTPGEQDLIRDRQDRLLEEQRRRLEELKDLPLSLIHICDLRG